ncbi:MULTISPECIES: ribosomal protection-like ABC-F family protein [unclassified Bacillus (in: firmicutes)]|uniref:ribosomal protection-like ABC-F family protein n=1 Tax=unclassified Bacillus (in: firmicutes) TaxID=185979 RepID=UPI0008EDE972|nr:MULTISPECIES: ABC-F type ribosomal protection protein [unclassified Bacillus (in: firmicutes)]SFA88973.1 macrolide transport system ATP-binding/permease protein [Bacillus sp. UNCCL13]SFQ84757.1 macrolide transport system ATP-binding/permease protein [Bacillus sp. cl95]
MFNRDNISPYIKLHEVSLSFAEKKILDKINLEIYPGEKIGLVGYNGAGKTTLAKLIFGSIDAENGSFMKKNPCKIGYLMQSTDIVLQSENILQDKQNFSYMTSQLGLLKTHQWNEEKLKNLSGGEKLKLSLADLWSSTPDLLILDEPTNHLDMKGMEWLIHEIKAFSGSVLMISHDRHFLDQTSSKIIEIENGKLIEYQGNYSEYKIEKQKNYEAQLHQYEVQQHKKMQIENQMDRLKRWSISAHIQSTKQGSASERRQIGYKEFHRVKAKKMDKQIKSKMKRLQQELDKRKIEKPKEDKAVAFEFSTQGKRGKRIVEAKGITKAFGSKTLFVESHFYIKQGDRVALIGENGCGKSTLLGIILQQQELSRGEMWVSESLKVAYLSQDVLDLPENLTPIDSLSLTKIEDIQKARTMLAHMGIDSNKLQKKISQLSLGERTKVKLVELLLKDYDVLILDEPTNHLDLPSREQLESTLCEYEGTLIIVSHDHYFIDKVCNQLLTFEDGKIYRVESGLSEWKENKMKRNVHSESEKKERMMIIENKLSAILGELSLIDQNDERYAALDQEFKKLLEDKKSIG